MLHARPVRETLPRVNPAQLGLSPPSVLQLEGSTPLHKQLAKIVTAAKKNGPQRAIEMLFPHQQQVLQQSPESQSTLHDHFP